MKYKENCDTSLTAVSYHVSCQCLLQLFIISDRQDVHFILSDPPPLHPWDCFNTVFYSVSQSSSRLTATYMRTYNYCCVRSMESHEEMGRKNCWEFNIDEKKNKGITPSDSEKTK